MTLAASTLLALVATAAAPPADRLSREGETCSRTYDCVAPLRCRDSVCVASPAGASAEPPARKDPESPRNRVVRIRANAHFGVMEDTLAWEQDFDVLGPRSLGPSAGGVVGFDAPLPVTDLVTVGADLSLLEHGGPGLRFLAVGVAFAPALRASVASGWIEVYLRLPIGFEVHVPSGSFEDSIESDGESEVSAGVGLSMAGFVGLSFLAGPHVGVCFELGVTHHNPVWSVQTPSFETPLEASFTQFGLRLGVLFLP